MISGGVRRMEDARVSRRAVKPSYVLLMCLSTAIGKLSIRGLFVRGQVNIFCLKPVHVTYVALQSVPENTYHKIIFKSQLDRGPTVTTVKYFSLYEHPCFNSSVNSTKR